jgi:alginate O-acetyltransferase complex protein AlgI
MQFNSFDFLFIFMPVVLGGYLLLRKTRLANLFMLLASLFFYAVGALWYLVPFFITALIDFVIGQKIASSDSEAYKKRLLIVSVVANLGLLSVFKYTGWLTTELAAILGMIGISFSPIALSLPPAISFYTFQSMSYTIDIYRKEFKPYRNVVDYLSFVSFFPHLVAGPIMRARDLLPQLARQRPLPDVATVALAIFMIIFGLFQKVVLADNFGSIVGMVDEQLRVNPAVPAGLGLLFAYAFAFQIYCDFAAYSTIARGVARLFGVELMRNFLTPYLSTNPSEFWTRWHISLSTWLRDYLYIPLGGNRHGSFATMRNLMITMVLGGLWHGAGLFFLIWGAFHGLVLIIYRVLPIDTWLIARFGRFGKLVAIVLFFHLVCIGWIFFRASPGQFWPIMSSIAALPGAIVNAFVAVGPYWAEVSGPIDAARLLKATMWQFVIANWYFSVLFWGFLLFAVPLWVTDYLGWRRGVEFPDLFVRMPWPVKSVLIVGLVYGIAYFGQRQANEFIYFAF